MVAQAMSKARRCTDFQFLYQFLIDNRQALLSRLKNSRVKNLFQNRSEAAIDMIYHWFSCKPNPKLYKKMRFLHQQNMRKLLNEYQSDIISQIQQVSTDHLARLAVAVYLCKLPNHKILLRKVERNFLAKIQQFDNINLAQIIRSFNKCNNNSGFGHDTTFIATQQAILQNNLAQKFSNKDLSEIMYTFANRRQGGSKLYQQFDKYLPQMIDLADNATMQNLIYYTLMRQFNGKPQFNSKQCWQKVIKKTVNATDILPITFHRSHKMAWMYLKQKYPQFSDNQNILGDFVDRLFYAERYYNHGKLITLMSNNIRKQHQEFKRYLYQILKLMPTQFHVHQNMWMIHYSWPKTKIGINLVLDEQLLDFRNKRISGRDLLMGQILGMQGWEILNLTWDEYRNFNHEERNAQIQGRLKALLERQKEKGIVPMEQVIYP